MNEKMHYLGTLGYYRIIFFRLTEEKLPLGLSNPQELREVSYRTYEKFYE